MPAKKLSMRKTKEILRLRIEHDQSNRAIARSCSISHMTVSEYIKRFLQSGLPWPLPEDIDDLTLQKALFQAEAPKELPDKPKMPEMQYLHKELSRPGVTLYMLWEEYRQQEPEGYSKSQFYHHYRRWAKKLHPTMRQEHKAGEKVFVDYAGKKPEIVDPKTGEIHAVDLFIGVLGASSYTYIEATRSQKLPDWISSHIRMLEFFGAAPSIVVPDNLKSGVTQACRYEPDINPTYQDLCDHYSLAVIPARSRKPKDKAKAESAVRIAETMVLGSLRDRTFFSLSELNKAIAEIVEELNNKKFQKLDTTRKALFYQLDRPLMRPLPPKRYEYSEWSKAKVNIDYHIEAKKNYYSVHYSLIHKSVDVRLSASTVEIYLRGRRIASHLRAYTQGKHQTLNAHRPPDHQKYIAWTPERILAWAKKVGPYTEQLLEIIMGRRRHPEQAYRGCLGILRLAQICTPKRLENACHRAIKIKGYSYKSVKSILDKGLDSQPLPGEEPTQDPLPFAHENIRGANYYTNPSEGGANNDTGTDN